MHELPLAQFENFELSWKFSFLCSFLWSRLLLLPSHGDDHWAGPLGHRQYPIWSLWRIQCECMSLNSVLATAIYVLGLDEDLWIALHVDFSFFSA